MLDDLLKQPLNRYAKMRRHKQELKKRHTKGIYSYIMSPKAEEIKMKADYARAFAENPRRKWLDGRNEGYTYWNVYSKSKARRFAKKQTSKKLRTSYRNLNVLEDPEDIRALKHAEYQKNFDYWWTIF